MTYQVISLQEVDESGAAVGTPVDYDINTSTPVFNEYSVRIGGKCRLLSCRKSTSSADTIRFKWWWRLCKTYHWNDLPQRTGLIINTLSVTNHVPGVPGA